MGQAMRAPYRLSTARILRRDWTAAGLTLVTAGMWVATAAVLAFPAGPGADEGMLQRIFVALAVLVTGACATAAVARIRTIRHVFATGAVVEGRVAALGESVEHVPTAEVAYSYGGREYRVSNFTVFARRAPAPGESVQLVVDPERPERAFVVELYVR